VTGPKTTPKKPAKLSTLEIVANSGEMIKPSELVEVKGATGLTLADRRLFNTLLRNAHGPDLGKAGHKFQIAISELKGAHESTDRLTDSIERLMRTVVAVTQPDASVDRVQLLGGNNLQSRKKGLLTYHMAPELAALARDSTIFAKLELNVMAAFTSKYALALYEVVARRARMDHVFTERFSVDDFRELLGVEPNKLQGIGNLHKFAIQPATREVNSLSDFAVSVTREKKGRTTTGFILGWAVKDVEGRKAAYTELQRHSTGRKARLNETGEVIAEDADQP